LRSQKPQTFSYFFFLFLPEAGKVSFFSCGGAAFGLVFLHPFPDGQNGDTAAAAATYFVNVCDSQKELLRRARNI
jgi:hypothetical protein